MTDAQPGTTGWTEGLCFYCVNADNCSKWAEAAKNFQKIRSCGNFEEGWG